MRAACGLAGRLVAAHGEPLAEPIGAVTHAFPSAAALADIDPASLGMPLARSRALVGLARAVDNGDLVLDGGVDRGEVGRTLLALPGIGQWTAGYVAMRELRDPDAFLPGDVGVRRSLVALGRDGSPRRAAELAERWRPYRAYALQHLWSHDRDLAAGRVSAEGRSTAEAHSPEEPLNGAGPGRSRRRAAGRARVAARTLAPARCSSQRRWSAVMRAAGGRGSRVDV